MSHNIFPRSVLIGILLLIISSSFSPIITANHEVQNKESHSFLKQLDNIEQATVTCYACGPKNSFNQQQQNLSAEKIKILFIKLLELNNLISQQSSNDNISRLQTDIMNFAKNNELLSHDYRLPTFPSFLKSHSMDQKTISPKSIDLLAFRRFQFLCNFISVGSGTTGPFVVFPRLVPILMFPIPRLFIMWSAEEGITSCGGLLRMLGFIAAGKQNGIALGFWGIGFSVFLPPVSAYGVFGYTLLVSVSAEEFIGYPFPLLFYLLWYLVY